jgi:hypothetical protein
LLRRAPVWNETEIRELLAAYLNAPTDSGLVDAWWQRVAKRGSHKRRDR